MFNCYVKKKKVDFLYGLKYVEPGIKDKSTWLYNIYSRWHLSSTSAHFQLHGY